MAINTVSSYMSESVSQYQSSKTSKTNDQVKENKATKSETSDAEKSSTAVVVSKDMERERVTYSKKSDKVDHATIEKLKREAEEKTQQLRTIVEKLLLKQSITFDSSLDIYDMIRSGTLEVDDETRLQAQKDIAEDGYWGVEQTSERLVSFAKALAGNDPEQADKMVEAFKKGYAAAEKQWGGKLPDICQKTYDAFMKKIDDWKKEGNHTEPVEE